MKYKVGDMVRVRKDLVVNNEYNGVIYILVVWMNSKMKNVL